MSGSSAAAAPAATSVSAGVALKQSSDLTAGPLGAAAMILGWALLGM